MALHTPVGTLLAYSTANPWWCPVVFRPSHIYSLGRLFLLMTPSTSQLHFIQPSCCSATTQPVREEPDAGSGKWPGGYSWAACLLSPWPPSLSVPAGKACHLRGRGPPWTNWGFVISPCYWGLHALLDKVFWKIGKLEGVCSPQQMPGTLAMEEARALGRWMWQSLPLLLTASVLELLVNTHNAHLDMGCETVGGDQVFHVSKTDGSRY